MSLNIFQSEKCWQNNTRSVSSGIHSHGCDWPAVGGEVGGLLEQRQPDQGDGGCDAEGTHELQHPAYDPRQPDQHLGQRGHQNGTLHLQLLPFK